MKELKEFLDASPTAFHAAVAIADELSERRFIQLSEGEAWKLEPGRGYFIKRDERAVMAFIPGRMDPWISGLNLVASHLDSPLWKLKLKGISRENGVWKLPVETYGSPIYRTWLDRELEVAGIVCHSDGGGGLKTTLWRSVRPLAVIPSLAIHYNREVNKGSELNAKTNMTAVMPAFSGSGNSGSRDIENPLLAIISEDPGIGEIFSSELYLVPTEKATYLGDGDAPLIISGRLDNLAMAHAILASIPDLDSGSSGEKGILAAWFDAEEVGNKTAAGAASVFLDEMIERIVLSAGGGREDLMRTRRKSFLISADMAHGVHPNHSDRHDPEYAPVMGGGPVLKSHGMKNYATDVHSEGRLLNAASRAGVVMQSLIVRSDLPCGSTLGPPASSITSINTVDIGNPLWGMHSCRETSSMADQKNLIRLLQECWKY